MAVLVNAATRTMPLSRCLSSARRISSWRSLLHTGKQIGAVRGEVRAAVVAHEQRHVQFSFERAHEVADAGLGVS